MRETPLLLKVMELLKGSNSPLSVPNIQALLLSENLSPNKTTLYRMLEKLADAGKIEALLLDPKVTYYEIKSHHHHHFVCDSCDIIKCVSDPDLESQIHALEYKLASKGMTIREHHFSLTGTCNTCN